MSKRNLVVLAGAALVVVVVVLAVAGAGSHRQGARGVSDNTQVSAGDLTAAQIYQRYERGVVEVVGASGPAHGSYRLVAGARRTQGLGFAVSGDGLILTSAQLVDHNGRIAKTVKVVFRAGATQTRRVVGTVVCVDAAHDLAVVRVDPAQVGALVPLPMGDSNGLRAGQTVIALGDPLAATPSLATTTVSATGREVRAASGAPLEAFVLSAVSLGSGDSGAPLIDLHGQVIAVVDQVGATAGGAGGAVSAVPIDVAARVIADALAG
ncbi:MAG: S1C family serine protease [Thermoleophilia bacterium]